MIYPFVVLNELNLAYASGRLGAEDRTPEVAEARKFIGKRPLKIQVKIRWRGDNPLEHATEQTIHWKTPLEIHWKVPLRSANLSQVSISDVQCFAPDVGQLSRSSLANRWEMRSCTSVSFSFGGNSLARLQLRLTARPLDKQSCSPNGKGAKRQGALALLRCKRQGTIFVMACGKNRP